MSQNNNFKQSCGPKVTSDNKWVPCHEGMACPEDTDEGNGLQVWKVAATMLNKQSRTAGNGSLPLKLAGFVCGYIMCS
jgi:hypothetical protein